MECWFSDWIFVGVVSQNNGLLLSQDENSSFQLEAGTQVFIRLQYDINVEGLSEIINQFNRFLGLLVAVMDLQVW
jgi:hypothetical protein